MRSSTGSGIRDQGPGARDQPPERHGDARPVSALGEHALIARIRSRLGPAPSWLLVDAGDDAAVYESPRNLSQVITSDAVVDGVHVDRRFVPPASIGHRALAVNLSDLAAMGAAPMLATLSLALPADLHVADLDALVDGLLAVAASSRTRLVGGNITSIRGPMVVNVTVVGTVHPRRILTRGGARPGDHLFVSGTLGDARVGLAMLQAGVDARAFETFPVARYLHPEARLRLGQSLGRRQAATSAIDLSDGLADGLARLSEASGVGVEIAADALPLHPATVVAARALGRDPVHEALAGGDDYELLFSVSPRRRGALRGVERLVSGLALTRIGTVTRAPGLVVLHPDGRREAVTGGYEHFAP